MSRRRLNIQFYLTSHALAADLLGAYLSTHIECELDARAEEIREQLETYGVLDIRFTVEVSTEEEKEGEDGVHTDNGGS